MASSGAVATGARRGRPRPYWAWAALMQRAVVIDGLEEYRVDYLPAESNTGMFGGNSNWRGPVWFPVNALLIRALLNFYLYYGDTFSGREAGAVAICRMTTGPGGL